MYEPVALKAPLTKPDVLVVGDTLVYHPLHLLARVLEVRNPFVTQPPKESVLIARAGELDALKTIVEDLHRLAIDPFYLRLGGKAADGPLQPNSPLSSWLTSVTSIGLHGLISFPRVHLLSIEGIDTHMRSLTTETFEATIPTGATSFEKLVENDPLRIPFAAVMTTLAYEEIVKKGLFDRLNPPDNTGEKREYATFERGIILGLLIRLMSMQTTLLRIRPTLRYMMMDQSRTRIREEYVSTNAEHFEAIISRVLNMPVHPWIAIAEGATLPTTRLTPWGTASQSILLDRALFRDSWDGSGNPTIDESRAYAREMNDKLDAAALLHTLEPLLKSLRDFMNELDQSEKMTSVVAALGFTKSARPVAVPVWSDAIRPWYSDSLNSNVAISDLLTASYQPHLPVQGKDGSPWIGDDSWVHYLGIQRANGAGTIWGDFAGTISVPPEDILYDADFYAGRFTPAMIQLKKEAFRGDSSAVEFPSTLRALSSVLGRTQQEVERAIARDPADWAHLFRVVSGEKPGSSHIEPVDPKGVAFYSERTQQPWLETIALPKVGVPTRLWALRRGRPEQAMPTRARFLRDTTIPTGSVPLAGAVTKLVGESVPAKLTGVIKP